MKIKVAFIALFASFASIVSAAQVTWTAGLFDTSAFTGGKIYLIQAPSAGTTEQIVNTIKQNQSLTYTGSTYTVLDIAEGSEIAEKASGLAVQNLSFGSAVSSDYANLGPLFVIAVSADLNNFAIVDEIKGADYTANTSTWTAKWLSPSGSTFETHSVPEPTAMALLALGIAGLALRRKA